MNDTPQPEKTPAAPLEVSVQRAAAAIAAVIMRGGDHVEAARAALAAARPSDAMAVRAARLLLTAEKALPEVHFAKGNPPHPLCGNPDGFGLGGHTTMTLDITCQGCMTALGYTEDSLARWEQMLHEPPPTGGMTREQIQEKYGV